MSRLIFLLASLLSAGFLYSQSPWPHGRIKVTADGRYLEYADGTPFFWLGDTGWELFRKLDTADIKMYLQNRRDKGFNVIQAVILSETSNRYAHKTMIDNDPLKPD